MALFIDIETTGLPDRKGLSFGKYHSYKQIDKYNSSRIVQVAMILCDVGSLAKQESHNVIINCKLEDFKINNSHIHGISEERSCKEGVSFSSFVEILNKILNQTQIILAHNIDFDLNIIKSELWRREQYFLVEELEKKKAICTMRTTKDLVYIKNRFGIKYPNLGELYRYATGKNLENAHDAFADVAQLHEAVEQLVCKDKFLINKARKCITNVSVSELRKRCSEQKLSGYSKMKKVELLELLQRNK